jgi:CDP-glucose 4,6-dehydratase
LGRTASASGAIAEPAVAESAAETTFWRDRPTFVTGATGLVGGWLVKRLLEAGADVVCLERDWVPHAELVRTGLLDQVRVVRGDVRDQPLVERVLGEYEIDSVIHLAAQAITTIANRNPISTFDTNIRGTWTVLEACRRSPTVRQIALASSDKAYGHHDTLPYREDLALRGRHPYDVSKSCADLIAQAYAETYGLPVAIARCGNFYGGGDLNWNRIVPGTIRSVLRQTRPIIRSDGEYVRDYFYVEDGAAAYMLLTRRLAERPELAGEAFNFSNESQQTVMGLVRRLLKLMGSGLEPDIHSKTTNEIREQFLSAEKARTMLGWRPLFSIDGGLRRTIAWYMKFLGEPD